MNHERLNAYDNIHLDEPRNAQMPRPPYPAMSSDDYDKEYHRFRMCVTAVIFSILAILFVQEVMK